VLLAAWTGLACAQQQPPLLSRPDAGLPIDLTAEYSELDRLNNRLVFRKLEVRQGTLTVRADEATASPADFIDSRWVLTGNVFFSNAEVEVRGSTAELGFRDNVLRTAVLRGSPATLRQPRTGARLPTDGRASMFEYDPGAGRIRMTGNAVLSDGPNEVTGEQIDYDLRRQVVSAGAGSDGPVRIRITPPADASKPGAAPAPPAPAPEAGPASAPDPAP
jgi:lipopolysaccharide transport protein LptA